MAWVSVAGAVQVLQIDKTDQMAWDLETDRVYFLG